MGLGELGNFSAFAFVSASIVAPLGAWSVVLNAFLAWRFLHETLDGRKFLGILFCIVGGVFLVIYGPSDQTLETQLDYRKLEYLLWRPTFLIYFGLVILFLPVLIFICWYTTIGNKNVICYLIICALLGALIVIHSKCLSILLRLGIQGDRSQLLNKLCFMSLIALICLIPIQILFINRALQRFTSSQVVPGYYVLFTLSSVVSSSILFDEFHNDVLFERIPFAFGIGQTFLGVFLLNVSSSPSTSYYTSPRSTHIQELRNLQLLDSFIQFRSYAAPHDELVTGRWYRKDSDFDIQMPNLSNCTWNQNRSIVPLRSIVTLTESNITYRGNEVESVWSQTTRNETTPQDPLWKSRTTGIAFPDSTTDDVRMEAEQIRNRHRAASWRDKDWYMEDDAQ